MTRHMPTRDRERRSFLLAQLTMKNLDFHLFEITCELKYTCSCANIVVNESLSSLSLAIKDNDPILLIIICS